MEAIKEWKDITDKATEKMEYLEKGLMELEAKMRKRLRDCQELGYEESEKLVMVYLMIDMRDIGNMITGVNKAKHEEGSSGTN